MIRGQAPLEVAAYFKALGLEPGASESAKRAAYIALAKLWHPDVNASEGARSKFDEIQQAYRIVRFVDSNCQPRADSSSSVVGLRCRAGPVRCSRCHRSSVQLRHRTFTIVRSFLVVARRSYAGGILCPTCARRGALKASFATGLVGWWSLPGFFLAPLAIFRNACGGSVDYNIDLPLLYHNLLAFRHEGNSHAVGEIAQLLAANPRHLSIQARLHVAGLLDNVSADASWPADAGRLRRLVEALPHVFCALLVPFLILGVYAG